jgi:hypothetical protein
LEGLELMNFEEDIIEPMTGEKGGRECSLGWRTVAKAGSA